MPSTYYFYERMVITVIEFLLKFAARIEAVTANVDLEKSANAMCEVLKIKEL